MKSELQRFEHYELVTGQDGKPVELGRGAMGVTFKAFDINLHWPVTLKVISERYSVTNQRDFVARAAASVRHPKCCLIPIVGHKDRDETKISYLRYLIKTLSQYPRKANSRED